jgi:hypothetical protein
MVTFLVATMPRLEAPLDNLVQRHECPAPGLAPRASDERRIEVHPFAIERAPGEIWHLIAKDVLARAGYA